MTMKPPCSSPTIKGPCATSYALRKSAFADPDTACGDMPVPSHLHGSILPRSFSVCPHGSHVLRGDAMVRVESHRIGATNPAIMESAAACDGDLRQHRLIWLGAAYRLAVAALPPLTYVASSLGYELDCLVQELDGQSHQTQESIQPVHRQFTSLRERRRCRLAGLTPLTYLYYSPSYCMIQTCVRVLFILMRILLPQQRLIASFDYVSPTKYPRESPRPVEALPARKTVLVMPSTNHNRKAA